MAISYLVLDDGTVYEGTSFGYEKDVSGELVFTTCSCGQQEELTDPSFRGQILVFTYPLFGNCGAVDGCDQSQDVHVRGVIVREFCDPAQISKYCNGKPMDEYLKKHKIPAISGIDTRELVIKIRENGTCKAAIVFDESSINETISKLKKMPMPDSEDLIKEVSVKEVKKFDFKKKTDIAVIDCGVKKAIIDKLGEDFNVVLFPYDTSSKDICASKCKAVVVAGGPGNPEKAEKVIKTVKELSEKMPVFGINLGHLIVAIALGAETYKLKFGHRGENQPVKLDNVVYMTMQNHGYAVDDKSLKNTGLKVEQINVNDGTVEGLIHNKLPIMTCQYDLQGVPGPSDTIFLFNRFANIVKEAKQ